MLGGQVLFFRQVRGHVVKLPLVRDGLDELVTIVVPGRGAGVRIDRRLALVVLPEPHRLGPLLHPALDQRNKADAVQGPHLVGHAGLHDLHEGRIDVNHAGGNFRDGGPLDAGRPLDHGRNADAALPDVALAAPQTPGDAVGVGLLRVDPAAVVAAEPDQRVVGNAQLPQAGAERPHAAVNPHKLAEVGRAARRLEIRGQGLVGGVRAAEPDGRQEGFFLVGHGADEFQGLGHDRIGAVAVDLHVLAVVAEGPIQVEPVRDRKPFIETKRARTERVGGGNRLAEAGHPVEVPFSEMRGDVARRLRRMGDGHFLPAQGHTGPEDPHAIRGAAGHHGGPRGRAALLRIETVEAQAGRGHAVQHGSLDLL